MKCGNGNETAERDALDELAEDLEKARSLRESSGSRADALVASLAARALEEQIRALLVLELVELTGRALELGIAPSDVRRALGQVRRALGPPLTGSLSDGLEVPR